MKKILSFILPLVIISGILTTPLVAKAATATSKAGAVTVSSGRLNVRSSASTGAAVVASLNKGSYITLISKSGSWWQVEYGKGQYGYCHADYITVVAGNPATVAISSGTLNVRSGAGTSYSRVAGLTKGEVVIVLSTSGGWSRILYHGTKTGYVSAQYLSTSSSSSEYSAVSLNVPKLWLVFSNWISASPLPEAKAINPKMDNIVAKITFFIIVCL